MSKALLLIFGLIPTLCLAASPCEPGTEGAAPSGTLVITRSADLPGFSLSEGRGCVALPLAAVWKNAQKASTWAWSQSTEDSYKRVDVAGADLAFLAHYYAGPIFFRQKWFMDFYHHVMKGTLASPDEITIQYQIDPERPGTRYITHWQGVVWLKTFSATATEVTLRDEVKAAQSDATTSQATLRQIYDGLRAGAATKLR